jgi:hypothetical protein
MVPTRTIRNMLLYMMPWLRVEGLEFRLQGLDFRVKSAEFRVEALRVQDLD